MKIGSIQVNDEPQIAVATSETDAALLTECWPDGPRDMLRVITAGTETWHRIAALARGSRQYPVDGLHWLPPVPRPGKVVCLALNNSAGRVHPEPELAVVIGRAGADIKAKNFESHVFGYTIINDLTSPTMRTVDTFHYRAIHPKADGSAGIDYIDTWVSYPGRYKGADTFGPMGPWIATRDEIPDPHQLTIRCLHKGQVLTEDSTHNLTFKVPEVIEFVSYYMTLEPGDIICLGTALKSAGGAQAVQTIDLNVLGGPIAVSVTGIGTLSNPVEKR